MNSLNFDSPTHPNLENMLGFCEEIHDAHNSTIYDICIVCPPDLLKRIITHPIFNINCYSVEIDLSCMVINLYGLKFKGTNIGNRFHCEIQMEDIVGYPNLEDMLEISGLSFTPHYKM